MTTTLHANEQAVLDAVPKQLFIGGEWRDGAAGKTSPVEDPATGETSRRSPTAPPTTRSPRSPPRHAAQAAWARDIRRASAGRSCAAPTS